MLLVKQLSANGSPLLTRSVFPSIEANHIAESYAEIMESVKVRIFKAEEAYNGQASKSRKAMRYKEIGSIFAS